MTERDFKHGLSTETLSVPDAAAYVNVSAETVRRLLQEGQIEGFRLSRAKVRIFKASVSRYLEEQQAVPVYDEQAQSRLHARRQQATRARQSAAGTPPPDPAPSRGAPAARRGGSAPSSPARANGSARTAGSPASHPGKSSPSRAARPAGPGHTGSRP